MTFEGDSVGCQVADAIRSSPAEDRRVLVDDYTRININDTDLRSRAARSNHKLQTEVRATSEMFVELANAGVAVRRTNPIARPALNYPCRNHKKLIVADNVAFIGGVNFSDHNFAWPDLMLRIEDSAAAEFLAEDFEATFASRPEFRSFASGDFRLISLDGRSNAEGFAAVFSLIARGAERDRRCQPLSQRPIHRRTRRGAAARRQRHAPDPLAEQQADCPRRPPVGCWAARLCCSGGGGDEPRQGHAYRPPPTDLGVFELRFRQPRRRRRVSGHRG